MLLCLIFLGWNLFSAPHPLTGSSIINSPENSYAFSQMGFTLESIPSNWIYNRNKKSDADVIDIGPKGQTLISFRHENVSVKTHLETYVRKYLRDYNQYGFEVISLQSYQNNKSHTPSVIVDLSQKNKNTKSRQIFFYRKNKMIIATCADKTDRYEKTVAICNQILATFKWRESSL